MTYPNPQTKTEFLALVEAWFGESHSDEERIQFIDWMNETAEDFMEWDEWEPTLMRLSLA